MTDKDNQHLHNNSSNGDQLDPQRIAQILKSAKDLEQIKSQTELSSVLVDKLFDFTKWVIKYSVETNTAKAHQEAFQSGPQSSAPAQLQSQQPSPTPQQQQSPAQYSAAPAQSQPQVVQHPSVAAQPQSQPAKHSTASAQPQSGQRSADQPHSGKPVTSSAASQTASQVSSSSSSSLQSTASVVPPYVQQPHAPQDVQKSTTQSRPTTSTFSKPRPVVTPPKPKALHDVSYKKVIAQKSVHRLIFLRQPDGHMKRVDQWHRFTRYGQKNIQTGKVQWGKWNKTEAQLPAYTIPVINGYHSKPTVIKAVKVTPESSDLITEVSYHADQETKAQWPTPEKGSSQNKPIVKKHHDKPGVKDQQRSTDQVATRRKNDDNAAPERKRQQRPSFFKLMWLTLTSLLGFRKTA